MKKKKQPSDLTVRNAKAYNKKFEIIEQRLDALTYDIDSLSQEYKDANHQLKKIMKYFQQYFTGRKK